MGRMSNSPQVSPTHKSAMPLSNAIDGIWKQSRWIKLRQPLKGDRKTLDETFALLPCRSQNRLQ